MTEFLKIVLPALVAIGAWYCNERSKLAWEQYKRKEENYKELLRCLKGFYVSTQDKELKNQFLHQVNLLWLYAPDHVIQSAYGFLEKVNAGASASDPEKETLCGTLVEAVRKDLLARHVLSKSYLDARDFRHIKLMCRPTGAVNRTPGKRRIANIAYPLVVLALNTSP